MDEYTPRIINGMTPAQARATLMQQVNTLREELAEMQEICVGISPHLAWAINQKMILIERGINGVETGVRIYFEQGENFG